MMAAIIAVVVIVAIVLALLATGVIPGLHPSGGPSSSKIVPPAPTTYSVVFTESGLTVGTGWSVTLNGSIASSTSSTISFSEVNGSFTYAVGAITGYSADRTSGTITVQGQAVNDLVTFTATSSGGGKYAVTFTESGLPAATGWSVALGGTTLSATTAAIQFQEPNGSYAYTLGAVSGYSAAPSSGTVPVNGAATGVSVTFTAHHVTPTYSVTFSQSTLPGSLSWSVNLNGTSQASSGATDVFTEPNGSYAYVVTAPAGYVAAPVSGTVGVAGHNVGVTVHFSNSSKSVGTYRVTFQETGLPAAQGWDVDLDIGGHLFVGESEGRSIGMALPNGSYNWSVFALSNSAYYASPGNGTLTVAGTPQVVSVTFLPPPTSASPTYSVRFVEGGLPSGASWGVIPNATLFNTSSTNSLTFSMANGSYSWYAFASVPGYIGVFGVLTVHGSGATVAFTFPVAYTVTFTETGLPAGGSWEVTVNGMTTSVSAGSSAVFSTANGTAVFSVTTLGSPNASSYSPNPAAGSLVVAGTNISQSITFTKVTSYTVTFSETGLPSGAGWEVDLSQETYYWTGAATGSASIPFSLIDGGYLWNAYQIPPNATYVATPAQGWVVVHGHTVTVTVTFSNAPADRQVVFADSLLWDFGNVQPPEGLYWNLTFNGITYPVGGGLLALQIPNGTYAYTISAPSGWIALPAAGNVTLDDSSPIGPLSSYAFGSLFIIVGFEPAPPSAHGALPLVAGHGPSPPGGAIAGGAMLGRSIASWRDRSAAGQDA